MYQLKRHSGLWIIYELRWSLSRKEIFTGAVKAAEPFDGFLLPSSLPCGRWNGAWVRWNCHVKVKECQLQNFKTFCSWILWNFETSTIALLVLLKLINCNPMPSINYRISFYWFLKMLNWLALIMLHELQQIPSNAIYASGFAIEAAPFMNGFNISWVVSFRKKNHRQIDHVNLLPRKYVFYAIKCILMPKRKIHEKI